MSFEPSIVHGSVTTLSPFRYWCQKVLPLVYDNSLSYYELLCKVVEYLNETMENVNTIGENTNALYNSYLELVEYVNNYFSDLNVQTQVDNKLDEMVVDGTFDEILTNLFGDVKTELNELKTSINYLPFVVTKENYDKYVEDTLKCIASYLAYMINSDGTQLSCVNKLSNTIKKYVAHYNDRKGYMGVLGLGEFVHDEIVNIQGVNYNVANYDCSTFLSLITKCIDFENSPYYLVFNGQPTANELFVSACESGNIDNKPYTFDFKNYIFATRMAYMMEESGNKLFKIDENNINNTVKHFKTGSILFVGNSRYAPSSYLNIAHCGYYLKTLDELNNYLSVYGISCNSSEGNISENGYIVHVSNIESYTKNVIRITTLEDFYSVHSPDSVYICNGYSNPFISNKSYRFLTGFFNEYETVGFGNRWEVLSPLTIHKNGDIYFKNIKIKGDYLTGNINLNDIEDGVYYSLNETDLDTIQNLPYKRQRFVLFSYGNKASIYQEVQIIFYDDDIIYYRVASSSGWGYWQSINNAIVMDNNQNLNTLPKGYANDGPGQDISGFQNMPNNFPNSLGVKIITLGDNNEMNKVQVLFGNNGALYYRCMIRGTSNWDRWYKISTEVVE